jgi:predicted nucleic acid-binding protein
VRAVLDADVLFGVLVRDTLLTLAAQRFGLYTPVWSETILAELERNQRRKLHRPADKVSHLITDMRAAFPTASVEPDPEAVAAMPNHPKDRHVLAIAISVPGTRVVTGNVRHFRQADWLGVKVQTPDEFLRDLFDMRPAVVRAAVAAQAMRLTRPPITVAQLVERYAIVGLIQFAARLRGSTGSA